MANKKNSGGKSLLNQTVMILLPLIAAMFLVIIILTAIGGFAREVVFMVLAMSLLMYGIAFAFGWKRARFPGVVGKVLYIFIAAVILVGLMLPPLLWYA